MQEQSVQVIEHFQSALNAVVSFIEHYPPVVLVVFVLSMVANLVQIGTYLRDRKRIAKEALEREKLAKLVETYEDVLKVARERIQDQEAAQALSNEVREKEDLARSLQERIATMERVAQRNLVKQSMNHHADALRIAYEELMRLRKQYAEIKIDMPDDKVAAIEAEMQSTLTEPTELPRAFVRRSVLLFLLLFLARWPVDGFLLPILLKPLLEAFFEVVRHLGIQRLSLTVARYCSSIVFVSAVAVWRNFYSAVSFIGSTFAEPVWPLANTVCDWVVWPVVLVTAYLITWRSLRDEMVERVTSFTVKMQKPNQAADATSELAPG